MPFRNICPRISAFVRLGALFIVVLFFPGCTFGGTGESPSLRGRIYLPLEKRFISEPELMERLKRAGVVYLGEKHDNPEHHRLQVKILRSLLRMGRRPAVVFEMFARDVNPALSAYLKNPEADLSKVPEIVGWKRMGWPDWLMYAPLVEIAHRRRLPVVGADLNAVLSRKIGRRGLGALPPEVARELALGPPEARHRSLVLDDLYESHCRMMPREKMGSLYDAWRARNRAMALSILNIVQRMNAEGGNGAIVITGGGHADRIRGIPPHVSKLGPGLTQFSLGFTEVGPLKRKISELIVHSGDYDAVWFTGSPQREDPCVQFKKSLEKMRSR